MVSYSGYWYASSTADAQQTNSNNWLLRLVLMLLFTLLGLVITVLVIGHALPQGVQIAYESTTLTTPPQRHIYLMDVMRALPARLSANNDNILSMNWSPDGSQLVFVAARSNAPARLYVMDVNQRLRTPLPDNILPISNTINWSPDGHAVAFMASSNGRSRIGIFDVEDDKLQVMDISNGGLYSVPDWAPNSEALVYLAYQSFSSNPGRPMLWTVPIGCVETQTCNKSSIRLLSPFNMYGYSWSPDGTTLIFNGVTPTEAGIYTAKLTCADITEGCLSTPEPLWSTSAHTRPVMSPDGKLVALRDDHNVITVIDVESRDARQVVTQSDIKDDVVWGTDGTEIIYEAHNRVTADVFAVNVENGTERRLTHSTNEDRRPKVRPS
ncbi:MAG: hypothetical protein R3E39_28505 [Anaerolineae bacterium]